MFLYPVLLSRRTFYPPPASGLHRSADHPAYFVQARVSSLDSAPPIDAITAEKIHPVTVGHRFGCVYDRVRRVMVSSGGRWRS